MKDKAIAIASIAFMLIAASSVLFDRLLVAYSIALIYAIVRWKISEQQGLIVKENYVKWLLRAFIVICCVILGAGGSGFSSAFEKSSPLISGLINLLGFVFAYDIGRYFNKIKLSKELDCIKNNEEKKITNIGQNKNLKVTNSIQLKWSIYMKKWTIRFSLIGIVVGFIFATINYGYIYESIDDFLFLLLVCSPFLLIGFLFGLFLDIILVSSEDKNLLKKNNPINSLNPDVKHEGSKSHNLTLQDNLNASKAKISSVNSETINSTSNELSSLIPANNDALWESIANEYDSDKRIKGLYAKLFAETNGDENKTRAMYYKQRMNELVKGGNKINLKDKEESNSDVFANYATLILQKANIKNTDANILKTTVYLCFAQVACLNVATQGQSRVFMDNMVEDAKKSVLALKMRVRELAQSDDELERILSDFPAEADVDGDTNINGLAAWNAIYFTYVEEIVLEISNRSKGPLGPYGYAAIKVLEALLGKGQGKDDFMDVSLLITEMTGKVIKSFR